MENKAKKRRFAYINRELAWLDFNGRILEQAQRNKVPLLERLRFLCITAANLDEFFMVRVGGLQLLKNEGKRRPDPSGMTPSQQLKAITAKARTFLQAQWDVAAEIDHQLQANGIKRMYWHDLSPHHAARLRDWCQATLAPLLTPMSLDQSNYTPLLHGLKLYLLIRVNHKGQDRFAAMPLGPGIPRHKFIPYADDLHYILLEDLVAANLDLWFGNAVIKEVVPFRLTRNADLAVGEDESEPFMQGMEQILEKRKESQVVRLEISDKVSDKSIKFLQNMLALEQNDIYTLKLPLQLADYFTLCDLDDFDKLRYKPWTPFPSPEFNREEPFFKQLAAKDILLFHPYESFTPVVYFVEEAAKDPQVLAIKQILYRTSANSPLVSALERAALNGKYVTVVVELKARFDEARNIGWARRLERAGVQVIYGVQHYKVHAKCCVVLRRENEHLRRYTHWSTGNYNENTAMLYSDVGLFSAREDLGADAAVLFNALCGLDTACNFHKINIAPLNLRSQLIALIDNEINQARAGQKACIVAKLNTCSDESVIAKMYAASRAGVEIRLNVRGACSLIPGIPGLSDNIRVISIVGRYLEHARILYFQNGGSPLMFITSADFMTRNLDKRVETLIPVENKKAVKKLKTILETYWEDNVNCWELNSQGVFELRKPHAKAKPVSVQNLFESIAAQNSKDAFAGKGFKPLRAKNKND